MRAVHCRPIRDSDSRVNLSQPAKRWQSSEAALQKRIHMKFSWAKRGWNVGHTPHSGGDRTIYLIPLRRSLLTARQAEGCGGNYTR